MELTSIKLIVKGANARAEVDGYLTTGMVGIPVTIEYDSSWAGLTKNMVCKSRAGSRMVLGVENAATVPHEVMSGNCGMYYTGNLYIGIEGRNAEGTLVMPTIWADCGTIRPGVNSNTDPSTDPTLPVWAQLQTDVEQLKENGVTDNQIAEAVEDYLEKNPVAVSGGVKTVNGVEPDENGNVEIEIPDSSQKVPDYWKDALDTGVKAINTALCDAGRNKSAFLFYSDAHWDYGSQLSPTLLKYLYQHTGMNKTFFGGDIVNDEATDYDTMEYLWEWRRQLKDLPNHHSVPGNHDDGNSTNNLFSEQYVYGYLLGAEETPDIVRGDSGLYYYIDNPAEKTRYLCLDTGYKDAYALSDGQSAFIKDSLKSTPDGWHIVVVAHIWYGLDYDQYDKRPVPIEGMSATASSITAILDNYNSRIGEFADCGAWVEFCIGGHIHYDYDAVTATGIPIILVETDSHHTRGSYTASPGTTTEASVNGIIADYDAHEIHVIRIGRGESRTVEITNYVLNYTNVLPMALAADGVSIYNADDTPGYKENTKWSESGQTEATSNGDYLTGYIPVSAGDIVYCKNVGLKNDTETGKLVMVQTFGTSSGSHNGSQLSQYCNATWHEDGTINSFVINNNVTTPYIRIMCKYLGPDSIITVNEKIGESTETPDNGTGTPDNGEDTGETPAYTNVLPTALAADGVSIYNASDTPGYKADTRWSTSGNTESTASGIYLTGWIPISAGDVIHLKHITLPNESREPLI